MRRPAASLPVHSWLVNLHCPPQLYKLFYNVCIRIAMTTKEKCCCKLCYSVCIIILLSIKRQVGAKDRLVQAVLQCVRECRAGYSRQCWCRLFEPYVIHVIGKLLNCYSDGSRLVRDGAHAAARAIMANLSGQGKPLCCVTKGLGLNSKPQPL